jgi:glyoxylase I family protein
MKKNFLGIDHPAIAADDTDSLAKWYCDVLGYAVFAKTDKPVYIVEAPDKTFIEIMPEDDTKRPERTICSPGFSHLALRVNDMDEAIAALDKHKVNWISDEFEAVGGGRIRNFTDPEGNVLQIVQRK